MIEDEDLHSGALEAFQMERASSGGYGYLNGTGMGAVPEIPKPIVYIGIAILLYFLFKELKK